MAERSKVLHNLKKPKEAEAQIMSLIRQDPENDKYWIYLYLYSKNPKALFKAYDINPGSSLVLNCLIAHYYRSKEFVKFFRAIQMAQKINHFNPNVISILMLLNA